jgi:hypothetical protein
MFRSPGGEVAVMSPGFASGDHRAVSVAPDLGVPVNRPGRTTLAVAAVSAAAVAVPLWAVAANGTGSPSCSTRTGAVSAAQAAVTHDQAALAKAGHRKAKTKKAKAKRQHKVAKATKRLAKDEARLTAAQSALIACLGTQPTTTVTVTATPTPTPTTAVWKSGTALLGEDIAPLGYWDGVPISGSAYGSAWTADPAHPGYFYGLTDRGPNVAYPDGSSLHKLEPLPGFQDAIGYFHVVGGQAQLVKRIGLTTPDGEPYGGLENKVADAGETIYDQYGDALPKSDAGLDTEGIAVDPNGGFWISDEYGPLIVHFDASGRQDNLLSPYVTTPTATEHPLPAELAHRNANKGMEGLTLTPDGTYLVGAMQSSLNNGGTPSAQGMITRIVKIRLSDFSVQEYLYSLHDAVNASNKAYEGQANSEIAALPDGTFLVDERDGKFEGEKDGKQAADKNLWKVDLTDATDVGPDSPLIGTTVAGGAVTWDDARGLLIGGRTIEDVAGNASGLASPADSGWQTNAGAPAAGGAAGALAAQGVHVAGESLFLNIAGLVSSIDPTGMYFGHDKVEGVAVDPSDPTRLFISNDSDFGLTDLPAGPAPTADKRAKGTDAEKFLPDGTTQDFGEVMAVDMSQVPSAFKG